MVKKLIAEQLFPETSEHTASASQVPAYP